MIVLRVDHLRSDPADQLPYLPDGDHTLSIPEEPVCRIGSGSMYQATAYDGNGDYVAHVSVVTHDHDCEMYMVDNWQGPQPHPEDVIAGVLDSWEWVAVNPEFPGLTEDWWPAFIGEDGWPTSLYHYLFTATAPRWEEAPPAPEIDPASLPI